jgi:3-methyladenine DNA glycosylase AlkD
MRKKKDAPGLVARPTARSVSRELMALADPLRSAILQRFFKTAPGEYGAGDRFLGLRVPALRRLARTHASMSLTEVSRLLRSRWHEARLLALLILVRQHARADAATRDAIHDLYVASTRYVNSWDLVDSSAEELVGAHLREPDRPLLARLAASPLVWDRRIAIIATFHYIKRGEFGDTLRIAGQLIGDSHDLIHKAVGWMLREVGNRDRAVAEAFLSRHAPRMPRTMLRYAIERFPPRLRKRYMAMR